MTFLSPLWLVTMWVTVALYWLAPRRLRLELLVVITAVFLAALSPVSAAILLGFTALCILVTRPAQPVLAPTLAAIGVIVAVLMNYKVRQSLGGTTLMETAVIPLGLSYFSFRCIHLILERYKGHLTPVPPREIVGYLFYVPTLVVGPIHRIDDYLRDLRRQRFDPSMLHEGVERIIHGYAKIAILSNYATEGRFGAWIGSFPDPTRPLVVYLRIVQTGLNLYFQFSGHSDVAIGFARLLGFRIIENLNWPYLKPNISAFWRSWHISLSRWSRDYVYGSVVALTRSPALGALSTMTVIGLWHEVSFRFCLWGAYHGAGLVVWQRWQGMKTARGWTASRALARPLHILSVLATVHFVWFGFVILSAESVGAALSTYRQLLFGWMGATPR